VQQTKRDRFFAEITTAIWDLYYKTFYGGKLRILVIRYSKKFYSTGPWCSYSGATTLSITTFSIYELYVTLSIKGLYVTLSMKNSTVMLSVIMVGVAFFYYYYAECRYDEYRGFLVLN
jgi:hypothetical protein